MSSRTNPGPSSSGEAATKVKAACEECRTRKTKVCGLLHCLWLQRCTDTAWCDGFRPICGRCNSKGRTCVYETEPDEFRITALKRRFAELARTSENNDAIVRLLREKDDEEGLEILERLRANESVPSILAAVGNEPGSTLSHEAESSLIAAIETTKTSSSSHEAAEGSRDSNPSVSPDVPTVPRNRQRDSLEKASIAFLLGNRPQSPVEPEQAPAELSTNVQMGSSSERESPEGMENDSTHSDEKRKRVFEPRRPDHTTHALAALVPPRIHSGGSFEPLANKTWSQDSSWMRGLERVKAQDWDVFYTDDITFLEILKCYFVWENPTLGYVHEPSFWQGLVSGGSEFCNLSLVHSILAYGSKIYGLFYPARAASVEQLALVAITNLWDWDADATVPANTSAGLLVHATLTSNGQDKDGQTYFDGAMNLVVRSGLFSQDRVSSCYPASNPELAKSRAAFAWNVYAQNGYHTLTFSVKSLLTHEPPIDIPEVDPDADSAQWHPFPIHGASRPSLISSKTHARAMLWRMGARILPLHKSHARDTTSEAHWRDTMALHEELHTWHETLHSRLNNIHGAPPHVFALHTDYYRCVIDLLRPFVNTSQKLPSEMSTHAHKITQESHRQLRYIILQMETQFSGLPVPLSALLTPLISVANETLPMIPRNGPQSDETFYFNLCLKMMRRMCGVYPVMGFVMRAFEQIAHREGVELPGEAQKLLAGLGPGQRDSLPLNSTYPVHHDLLTTDVEASNLQTLINEINGLSLDRHGTASSGEEDSKSYLVGGKEGI